MLLLNLDNINQQRTLKPLYVNTQATAKDGFLDPSWDKSADILPGSVMARVQGSHLWTLYTGATGQKPSGLSALFVAPKLGIDEINKITVNAFSVWMGDAQAEFEVLAPAFDTTADWTPNTDGSRKLLYATKTAHAQGPGLLTTTTASDVGTDPIAELIETVSEKKIIISLNRIA